MYDTLLSEYWERAFRLSGRFKNPKATISIQNLEGRTYSF